MSLHKLTAGDGYTYLTRQVAACDATHRGRDGLSDYYSEQGESPGVWLGHGADGLSQFLAPTETMPAASPPGREALAAPPAALAAAPAAAARVGVHVASGTRLAGRQVSERQMLALFGEGRHPDADPIEKHLIAGGHSARVALAATRLGSPYKLVNGPGGFRIELARRFEQANADAGLPRDWPVPETERAAIRTALGREMFSAQYGRAPTGARELSGLMARASRQQSTAVAGYDLTFTPVKSVSALWAIAPRQVAQAIEQAHAQAVEQCLTWLEANAAYTRLGRGAVRQVETRGLIAAAFTHRDSRAGDPNLHTHVAVSNKVQVADTAAAGADAGRWLALDGRPLHKLTVAASERYNTRLEALLRDTLGVEFTERAGEPGKRPVREIVGVDARLLTTWSARRRMINVRRGGARRAVPGPARPPTRAHRGPQTRPAGNTGNPAGQARAAVPRPAAPGVARRRAPRAGHTASPGRDARQCPARPTCPPSRAPGPARAPRGPGCGHPELGRRHRRAGPDHGAEQPRDVAAGARPG